MPRLGNLKPQKPVEIVFEAEGESVTVVFDKNAMTPNWAKQINDGIQGDDSVGITRALAEIIISWDVEDADPTAEVLGSLPFDVLMRLEQRITEATIPSSEEGNVSSQPSSSPPLASSESSQSSPQNGATSPSPAHSASPLPT